MLNEFSVQWCESINEIDRSEWETIFGHSQIKDYSLFYNMEQSKFDRVDYYYLLIRKQGVLKIIIPCFYYNLDLLQLINSNKTITIVKKIRRLFPKLLMLKTFVTGSYIATCEHFIGYHINLPKEDEKTLLKILNQQLRIKYKETKSQLIFIKDIRERSLNNIKRILDKDYNFFESYPTTAIPILNNFLPYPLALKKKQRKRYKKYKEKFQENFQWEIIVDFEDYVSILAILYQNVLKKAKNKFEELNKNFFYNLNKSFPKESYLLVARDLNREIRLMEVILEEEDRLLPLYLGINYKDDDTKILYLNAIFETVEEAARRGKDLVDFGQTSYYPKVMSGAFVENIYYGFWSDKFCLKVVIKHLFKKIFLPQYIPQNVYLEKYEAKVYEILESRGFILLNK